MPSIAGELQPAGKDADSPQMPQQPIGTVPDASSQASRRVVLVAGGTAGHVYPALAIADACRRHPCSIEVLFFGTDNGFEAKLLPCYGYPFQVVRSTPMVGETLAGKARTIGGLGVAIMRARRMLVAARADLVVGFGGYASVPTMLAARSLGVPTAIHECNVVAGLANRLLGRLVDRVYLGFEAAGGQFQANLALITGNPVRPDVGALSNQCHQPPSPARPAHIFVTGGSQGSSFLNRQVPMLLARLAASAPAIEVLHQSGLADSQTVRETYRKAGLNATVTPFVEDMATAYQWADIVIACSGAATLAEVATVGVPVVLIPLSTAANNHQVSNAAAFSTVTGGCWQSEEHWSPEVLLPKITAWLSQPEAWREASRGVRRFAKPEASRMVVADCEAILQAKRPC